MTNSLVFFKKPRSLLWTTCLIADFDGWLTQRSLQGSYSKEWRKSLGDGCRCPQPDWIPLDIVMPGMTGYDVCKRLKEDLLTRDIPIIFPTALTTPEEERQGLDMGAADFVTKPVNSHIMLARVATQLYVKEAADFYDTGNHIRRTQNYVRALAEKLRYHLVFYTSSTTALSICCLSQRPCMISVR